jgi:hypothetical protein
MSGFRVNQALALGIPSQRNKRVHSCQNGVMNRAASAHFVFAAMMITSCAQQPTVRVLAQTEPHTGLIEGTVSYENGGPVDGATVYASPMDRAIGGIIPNAKTDRAGHFAISHLWFGKFAVGAEKLDEDYPNMTEQFYSDGKFETVTLTSRRAAASVGIRLGPKAGILTGTVVDAITDAPLNPCVDFTRSSNPNNFLSGTGLVNAEYRVLVPSDTDVNMKIWHDGYKPWYYPGSVDKSERKPVHLKPGEIRTLNIRLQPGNNPAEAGCETPLCFPNCRP